MRICIASGTYHPDVGGPPTYLYALAEELVRRSHGVRVVTYGRSEGDYPYRVVRVSRELPAPLRLARFAALTAREARQADLLYVNDYGLPPAAANLPLRKPLVMKIVGDFAWEYATRHQFLPPGLSIDEFQRRRFGGRVERLRALQAWYAGRADFIITPSHYLTNLVTGWGIAPERLRVIPNAPPPDFTSGLDCHPLAGLGFSRYADFVVATVARLAPWKGVDVLIRALARARARAPNPRLLVVGDGDERARLERLAEPLGDGVRFVGEVDRKMALRMLREADAVALCSSYEGLSHVLLEAMEAGKPIIATAVGGNLELIRDGRNGLLVPYGDEVALAEALVRLATDHELRERLGGQARRDAEARSWPRLVEATLAVFEEALGRYGVGRR